MMKDLTFTRCGHLGKSSRDEDHDQKLAVDQHGNWYLYDWSGDYPDTTDDGPLRVDLGRPIKVGVEGCTVQVIAIRDADVDLEDKRYFVHVTHAGMVKMLAKLHEWGERAIPKVLLDEEDTRLTAIVELALFQKLQQEAA
jgi:hypothetical protein